jgi:hypothetical protein
MMSVSPEDESVLAITLENCISYISVAPFIMEKYMLNIVPILGNWNISWQQKLSGNLLNASVDKEGKIIALNYS